MRSRASVSRSECTIAYTTDAHIAVYAIEHAGMVYSNDSDFARFEGLRWKNPPAS